MRRCAALLYKIKVRSGECFYDLSPWLFLVMKNQLVINYVIELPCNYAAWLVKASSCDYLRGQSPAFTGFFGKIGRNFRLSARNSLIFSTHLKF
jgi:hypothetical protein